MWEQKFIVMLEFADMESDVMHKLSSHLSEYQEMFALSDTELKGKLLEYVPEAGCTLPFAHFEFDFALSSHYLFTNLDDKDTKSRLNVIRELARVAKEVRIFPLIDDAGQLSPFLGPVLLGLQQEGYGVEVRDVNSKGNPILRVWAQQCQLD